MYCQLRQMHDKIPSYLERELPLEVPEKGKLVYVGSMTLKVKAIKVFSFTTSVVALSFMPNGLVKFAAQGYSLPLQIAVGSGLVAFILLQPILFHLLNKRYVTWIYYKEEENKFTASTYSFLGRPVDHVFTPDDVEYFALGLLSNIKVRGKPFVIATADFFHKEIYPRMMRYDTEEWETPKETEELKADVENKEKEQTFEERKRN